MNWLGSLDLFSAPPDGTVVTWGVFDGVHLGHQAIFRETARLAGRLGAEPVVLPFAGHPDAVLWNRAVRSLTTPGQRRRAIERLGHFRWGIELVFDAELAAVPAERFVEETLAGRLKARGIVVGHDTTFGQGGRGDERLLRAMGERLGFETVRVAPVSMDGTPVSSTEIRARLAAGDVRGAATLLGRPYALEGKVVEGDRRGRTLGFPTANLDAGAQVLPARGVYAGQSSVEGRTYPAVLNVGTRPTFGGQDKTVPEAHLIGFEGDLYDRVLEVEIRERLRDERRFSGVEALGAQIREDAKRCGELYAAGFPG